jgi:hypothetical protein
MVLVLKKITQYDTIYNLDVMNKLEKSGGK